jgi:hypothetical protein
MNATRSKNAQSLFAFLEEEWDRMGLKPTAWTRKVGIPDATVLRWRDGIEPDMRSLKRIAEALERPLVDVLLAAEYITPDEVSGYVPQPRSYDLLEAIELDPKLSDGEREALRQVHDAFRLVESGQVRKKRVRGRTGS